MSFSMHIIFFVLAASAFGERLDEPAPAAEEIEPDRPLYPTDEDASILLLEWIPYPIDEYHYVVVNGSNGYATEHGDEKLSFFTKKAFPDVKLVFTVVPGDEDYTYVDLGVPLIGTDAFKNDKIFMDYLDLIYTIHGFPNKVEMWAHFLRYQEAFWPIRDRLSDTFQAYLEEQMANANGGKAKSPETEDFQGHESQAVPETANKKNQ